MTFRVNNCKMTLKEPKKVFLKPTGQESTTKSKSKLSSHLSASRKGNSLNSTIS
jgi:hypothetical protein